MHLDVRWGLQKVRNQRSDESKKEKKVQEVGSDMAFAGDIVLGRSRVPYSYT
jgi:hypothetical protein